ncbi:MAG: VOC family protein [Acidobacteria bacterium]|nr:VOC family protein [Acidobacteriota bacterium]
MLTGLWTVGIKVPDLDRELAFHRSMGNTVVLDETLEFAGNRFRIPLIRMGDKYLHIAERMVYEHLLDQPLAYGIVHLVYMSDGIERDLEIAKASGAVPFISLADITGGFGRRKVAFLRSPNGYIFEIIQILENLVPPV